MAATVCSLRWPIVNEDGEQESKMFMKKASFFTAAQVEAIA